MQGSGSICAAERGAGHKAQGEAEAKAGDKGMSTASFLPSLPLNFPLWHLVS